MRVADIPGYVEAVIRERFVRDVAVLGVNEKVNGFELVPVTLRHFTILKIANSPFLPPFTEATEQDVIELLWLLNPRYEASQKKLAKFMKRCKAFRTPKIPFLHTRRAVKRWLNRKDKALDNLAEMVKALQGFMSETFQDRPPHVDSPIPEPSYYSDAVSVLGILCREWHNPINDALNLPLKLVFQILNEHRDTIFAKAGQSAIMFNPSDAVKARWAREHNERKN